MIDQVSKRSNYEHYIVVPCISELLKKEAKRQIGTILLQKKLIFIDLDKKQFNCRACSTRVVYPKIYCSLHWAVIPEELQNKYLYLIKVGEPVYSSKLNAIIEDCDIALLHHYSILARKEMIERGDGNE